MASAVQSSEASFWREILMLDIVFVLSTVAFFAGSLAYVAGCDKL